MSEPKNCPRCRLVNAPEALRCDCGYDFVAGELVGSLLPARPPAFGAGSVLLLGLMLVVSGVIAGGGIGVPLWVSVAGPGPDGCGLGVLPVILEGLIGGALLGAFVGVATTVVIASRWRKLPVR